MDGLVADVLQTKMGPRLALSKNSFFHVLCLTAIPNQFSGYAGA